MSGDADKQWNDFYKSVVSFFNLTQEDLKTQILLREKEGVTFILLNKKANTFDIEFGLELKSIIDKLAASQKELVLVTISLQQNIYSGGLDLSFVKAAREGNPEKIENLRQQTRRSLASLLTLNAPTICLNTGAAIGAGAFLVLAHQYVIGLQSPQTILCANEIEMDLPITDIPMEIARKKIMNPILFNQIILEAKRLNPELAVKEKIYNSHYQGAVILDETIQFAKSLIKYSQFRDTYNQIKSTRDHMLLSMLQRPKL